MGERPTKRHNTCFYQMGHSFPDSKVPEAKLNRGFFGNLKSDPNGVVPCRYSTPLHRTECMSFFHC